MVLSRLLPLLAIGGVTALPALPDVLESAGSQLQLQAERLQTPIDWAAGLIEDTVEAIDFLAEQAHRVVEGVKYDAEQTYTLVSHPAFPSHTLRLKQPTLCDANVTQYSGYLDVAQGRHLFFWYFDSRNDPENDPLVMWLNGGPGCSSMTGLLFELGPCRVTSGSNTELNPYSWTEAASLVFLDQPVQVGYSWTEGGGISTTKDAAEDVRAFMQLWYAQFPETRSRDFHIAGESYGGHYVPNFASAIHHGNLALQSLPQSFQAVANLVHVPLTSILIGNGLTDPLVQFPTVPDFACEPAEYPIFDASTCTSIRSKVSTCTRLVKSCYDSGSRWSCVPAQLYCNSAAMGPIVSSGRNPYDVRLPCDRNKDGDLCYKEMGLIDEWMNRDEVKQELGVPSQLEFQSCNGQINSGFMLNGDGMHNSAAVIPELLDAGVRVLIYAGAADFMCNWIGNLAWVLALENQFQPELLDASAVNASIDGVKAAEIRQAGPGAGNFTYVKVLNAGHMVPMDQPEYAFDMFSKWLANKPLYDQE